MTWVRNDFQKSFLVVVQLYWVRNDQNGYEMTWVRNGCYWIRNDQKMGTKLPKWYEVTWVRNDLGPKLPVTTEMTLIDFKTMSNFAKRVFVLTVDPDIRRAFTGPLVVWSKAFTIYRKGGHLGHVTLGHFVISDRSHLNTDSNVRRIWTCADNVGHLYKRLLSL